jgi:hypothetical protein
MVLPAWVIFRYVIGLNYYCMVHAPAMINGGFTESLSNDQDNCQYNGIFKDSGMHSTAVCVSPGNN